MPFYFLSNGVKNYQIPFYDCYLAGLQDKLVSGHWQLFWRPSNREKCKNGGLPQNKTYPTTSLYRVFHE